MSARLRTVRVAVVVAAVFAAIMVAPGVASANLVDDVVKGVNDTLNNLLGGDKGDDAAAPETVTAEPTPNAGTPPNYVPPAHGSDQHAQGTPATVDLTPSDALPLPYDPAGGSEEVVVGGSRGSVNGGDYHGHVTILALLGNELIEGADTAEGQTSAGPLGDLNAALADICSSSGICLSVLSVPLGDHREGFEQQLLGRRREHRSRGHARSRPRRGRVERGDLAGRRLPHRHRRKRRCQPERPGDHCERDRLELRVARMQRRLGVADEQLERARVGRRGPAAAGPGL